MVEGEEEPREPLDRCEELLQEVLKAEPDNAKAHFRRAQLLRERADVKAARDELVRKPTSPATPPSTVCTSIYQQRDYSKHPSSNGAPLNEYWATSSIFCHLDGRPRPDPLHLMA